MVTKGYQYRETIRLQGSMGTRPLCSDRLLITDLADDTVCFINIALSTSHHNFCLIVRVRASLLSLAGAGSQETKSSSPRNQPDGIFPACPSILLLAHAPSCYDRAKDPVV